MKQGGELLSIKLVHKSGYVICKSAGGASNWGCNDTRLGVVLTDSSDQLIFPAKINNRGWYTDSLFTSQSAEIVLDKPVKDVRVKVR